MSTELPTMEQIAEAVRSMEASAISLPCILLLANPLGLQALGAIRAAQATGAIRDRRHCEELAGDSGKLGAALGGTIAGLIAGRTALCACNVVFPEPPPPPPPQAGGTARTIRDNEVSPRPI
jgi:hypothetical protein